jgi:MFS family permease
LLGTAANIVTLAALMVAIGIVSTTRTLTSESYIAGNTPERRRATVLGLYFFAGTEVSGLLTPVLGTLIDRFGFYSSFTIAGASMAAVVVVCSLLLWKYRN